jgi:putative Holliday junction resolvase
MRQGRRLGFDVGRARTGVAVSSPDGLFASPVGVALTINEALNFVREYDPIELYVGLPLSLSGTFTASTDFAVDYARQLESLTQLPVRLIDERLTTSSAASLLRSAGKNARSAKNSIDSAAATLILEQALSIERAGSIPGKLPEELS